MNPPDCAPSPSTTGAALANRAGPNPGSQPLLGSAVALLPAAAVAAVVAALSIHQFGSPFALPREVTAGIGAVATPEQVAAVTAAKRTRDRNNACVTMCLAGAVLGLCLGAAAGRVASGPGRFVVALAGGAGLGAVGGVVSGLGISLLTQSALSGLEPEHRTILSTALGWGLTCLAAGGGALLAFRGHPSVASGLLAAGVGGLVGGVAYVPVVSLLLPSVDVELLLPDSLPARIVWAELPAVVTAVVLGRALSHAAPASAVPANRT